MLLAELLYKHFNMINSRAKVFAAIIKALILCRGSNYKNMASEIEGETLLESKIKSVSRFLDGDNIDEDCYYEFIKEHMPPGKVCISIDRTSWELGRIVRNLLVITVSYDKIGMPVLFKSISHRGSCTANDQIEIIGGWIILLVVYL